MASILLALESPPIGGDTLFCDAYAMWEGLSPQLKQEIEPLCCYHEGQRLHGQPPDYVAPSSVHPAVRTHPETGGTTLFVNPQFTMSFEGVSQTDSERLLAACTSVVGRAEYCCRFRWEAGSIAMW
jgi:taurine dioxygenase